MGWIVGPAPRLSMPHSRAVSQRETIRRRVRLLTGSHGAASHFFGRGMAPACVQWHSANGSFPKRSPILAGVRATDRCEPMTFSQREKVPMECPRGARTFHRRMRGDKAEGLRSFSRHVLRAGATGAGRGNIMGLRNGQRRRRATPARRTCRLIQRRPSASGRCDSRNALGRTPVPSCFLSVFTQRDTHQYQNSGCATWRTSRPQSGELRSPCPAPDRRRKAGSSGRRSHRHG